MSGSTTTAPGETVDNVRELHHELHERRRAMQRVDHELDDITGHLNAQYGRLIDVTVWLLAHPEEWSGEGVWTPQQFLAWRCGIGRPVADKIVALAERADELPETVSAIRAGELSIDQAAPIAKRVPGWAEQRVVSLAKRLTVRQIQRTVAQYDFTLDDICDAETEPHAAGTDGADGADDPTTADHGVPGSPVDDTTESSDALEPDDRCWYGVGDDGRWRLFVETTRDIGDVVAAALDEARDARFRRDGGNVTALDALTEVAQRSLAAVGSPTRRERHRTYLHLQVDGTATDAHGIALPDQLLRHLTCDGIVAPVFVERGMPVSVGRSERVVPDRTRRIVLLRDGGCRVPGCDVRHHLEIHHIVHWSDHGPTDTWNLVALCPRHHRLHHQGKLGISGNADDPDGIAFTGTDGRPIRPSGASPNPPTGPPPPITGTYEHPLGERLDGRYVDFHPPPAPLWSRTG